MTDKTENKTQKRPDSRAGDRADGQAPGCRRPATALARAGTRVRSRARSLPSWSLLIAGALAGTLAGGAYGLARSPQYTATSYVVAVPAEGSDPASALGFAQAYGRVATQLAVLGDAQVWAGVPAATLEESVRTATSPDAPMVAVTATSARPGLAADMANAVARALTQHASTTAHATHVGLRQFARATEPAEPSSASAALTGLVGASAGGLLGALGLLVRPRRAADTPGRPAAVPGPAHAPVPTSDVRGHL
ncbi:lipopolysaccharide biosynthesis protein [Streptomyces sp. HMX87]|uniref:lipopolysaccharide biosynthesis protein n=1 Tax=Streptomyces sp. HMX87 TaxID=3390849 RepID=UPI003A8A0DD1